MWTRARPERARALEGALELPLYRVKKLILLLGDGPVDDREIRRRLGMDEARLMNLILHKQYKELFVAVHRPECTVVALSAEGREALAELQRELRDARRARYANIRWWVTTGIALAAFVKAFFLN